MNTEQIAESKSQLRYSKLRAWQKSIVAMINQIDKDMIGSGSLSRDIVARLNHASNALFQADSNLNAAANQISKES